MLGRVFITRPIFEETIVALRREAEVRANMEDRILSRAELIDDLKEADAAITLITERLNSELSTATQRLKIVADFGVGYNNVDVEAATRSGVVVTNTPGVLTETTADLAWSLMMSAARRISEGD